MKNNFFSSIKNKKLITQVVHSKNIVQNNICVIKYLKNNENKLNYIISTPKKYFKLAVTRNKIKRQVRSIIFEHKANNNMNIIIIIRDTYLNNTFNVNKALISELLNRIENNLWHM
ncbi:MAG: ribonuclease P protein component [Mycoplasmataceae bacterium]|nr:ribonuclease P protein component [Mycoplasmataceae bacterium]